MPDHMLTLEEARKQGFDPDPLVFHECTDRVDHKALSRARYFQSRFYFAGVTEILSEDELEMTWISFRRNDRRAIQDWRHLQRIKNELTDPEREAVQIYPAESRLLDESNQIHLWVYPLGYRLPFGYAKRSVMTATETALQFEAVTNHMPDLKMHPPVQRPFPASVEAKSRSYEEMIDDLSNRAETLHVETVHRSEAREES